MWCEVRLPPASVREQCRKDPAHVDRRNASEESDGWRDRRSAWVRHQLNLQEIITVREPRLVTNDARSVASRVAEGYLTEHLVGKLSAIVLILPLQTIANRDLAE